MALSSSLVSLGTFVGIYALLALGLNIKFGYNGLLDIGHVTFYLVGAYVTVLLVLPPSETQQFATYILGWNWPWVPAVLVGVVLSGVAGMLVALPAIRLREDYLAITVLGFSVIAKRIIQTQGWLANGPGSLRGYAPPLVQFFPLPAGGVASAVLFGAIVLVFWTVATYLLATVGDVSRARTLRAKLVHALFAVTTLGVGYVGARLAVRGEADAPTARYPVAAGIVAGAVAGGLSAAGRPVIAARAFLGLLSVFTWAFVAVAVSERYAEMDRRDALAGLALAVLFVVAFLPLVLLGGGGGDALSTVGLALTILFLAAFLYGVYRLANDWARFSSGAEFVSVLGVGALWLFAIRYFLVGLVAPFKQGGLVAARNQLWQNVLWLIKFTDAGIQFNYARFVFVLTVAAVAGGYYLSEMTVMSPFGRVLKAIREDEDVATALGKNTFVFKTQSMVIGSALAGLAGALWALSVGALVHTMFAPRVTFIVLLMVIIGGTANNRGVILGAAIFWAFQKGTETIAGFFPTAARTSVQALRLAFIGALLIVILYYREEGIIPEEKMTSPEVKE